MKPSHYYRFALLIAFLSINASSYGQGTSDDYRRAAQLQQIYGSTLKNDAPSYFWQGDSLILEFSIDGKSGYQKFDTSSCKLEAVDDPGQFKNDTNLEPLSKWEPSGNSSKRVDITFVNEFDKAVRLFWVNRGGGMRSFGVVEPGTEKTISTFHGHYWVIDFKRNDIAGIFIAAPWNCRAVINEESQSKVDMPGIESQPQQSNTKRNLAIRRHNVWLRNDQGDDIQITTNGTENDPYLRRIHYSPNGRYALAFRETKVNRRQIPLVESSPRDQVHPKLKWITYVKPGDDLPQRRPIIIDVENGKLVPVDENYFKDSWSVQFQRWSKDGEHAYLLYNQRGHQQLALRSIDCANGETKDVINETSKTFVDYSQKTTLRWLKKKNQVIWASERDGWNHLYRIDADSGDVINQVTKGPWVVRDVELIDEEKEEVWFTAMGIHSDQDPYHRHLAKVNFDGSDLTVITSGDGTHRWEFSPDRKFVVDKFSKVDQPPTWELVRTSDGKRLHTIWQQDIQSLSDTGYETPVRFSAPGRDGETMIYGYIIKPSNFDPTKKYPVIEDIYAGPHGHHVGKSFGLQIRPRSIAELGFIVVKIDGMGTNWRSKKFHDVCWQNLDDGGFPDRIAWIKAAAEKYPWMDVSKVGIFGGSAGGQNALAALLHHGNFYHVAVSDCGCHDNRMDKIWWNEAWMGKMGPHYEQCSNVTHAAKLQGDLMLTVGEIDSNVDPASTMQVVDALIRANKDFDLIIAPGRGHGVGESAYLARRRQDFFVRKLLGVEPRN